MKKKKNPAPAIPKEHTFTIGESLSLCDYYRQFRQKPHINSNGKSPAVYTQSKQGKYVRSAKRDKVSDIALDATLREFVRQSPGRRLPVPAKCLQQKIRRGKATLLTVLVVDASGSMGVQNRMTATKGAVLSLLKKAYQHKDRLALISFRGQEATLILPPTRSVLKAKRHLEMVPTGGQTPLAGGLWQALLTIKRERMKNDNIIPHIVLLSDGKGNVPIWKNAYQDVLKLCRDIKQQKIFMLALDTSQAKIGNGHMALVARTANAQYLHLDNLESGSIESVLSQEMKQIKTGITRISA